MLGLNKSVRFVLLLSIGLLLIYLSLGKLDLQQLFVTIKQGNFIVAIPIFGISVLGYWVRSLRWKLVLQSMHESPQTGHLFAALSMGYAVNFATPRLGEIARCLVLQKTNQVKIEKAVMSVVVERVIDILCLIAIVLVVATLNVNQSALFFTQYVFAPIVNMLQQVQWLLLLVILFLLLLIGYWVLHKIRTHKRVATFIKQTIGSLQSILYLKQRIRFVIYTLIIWSCYYLMTYLWFFTFAETAVLGFREAFVIMAVGSIGRSVPIQGGGMGAYHFLVSNAFGLFGVSLLMGNAMAIVIHGAQMVLTVILGLSSWLWMLFYIRTQK